MTSPAKRNRSIQLLWFNRCLANWEN